MTTETTLNWMGSLVCGAVVLQTIELLWIKNTYYADGIWRWTDLRLELGDGLGWVLGDQVFGGLLWLRLLAALAYPFFPNAFLVLFLFLSTLLICVRWRGTFNGGSDSMTVLVLGALLSCRVFESYPKIVVGSLMYVGIQVCLSYFIAGLVKIRRAEWRCGNALSKYVHAGYYDVGPALRRIGPHSSLWLPASWLIMVFELMSPAAFWSPWSCMCFIGLALFFHLANVYALGLNRFFFAWASALPALLFCSEALNRVWSG